MPGNEVGDRIHNFFGQENLTQGQPQSQVIDRSWPGLSNNLWTGNRRQIGTSHISNLKNIQQSADSERGHASHSSGMQQAFNFSQATLRPDFARSQSQSQQTSLNGYMHGYQAFTTRQNEEKFLAIDTEGDQHNFMSRGFSVLNSELGTVPENHEKNSTRMDFTESPVNFDFFGGRQQMNSQHPGMMQSLTRQQPGINDMQLLQQEVILKQMQEIQQQQQHQKQQMQQQEPRQPHSLHQVSSFVQQGASGQSQAINGIPIHEPSNYSWRPELMTSSPNWPQHGMPPVMHGSSSGLTLPPEQGHIPDLMGLVPQQIDKSFYSVPISGTRVTPSHSSATQMEKPRIQQISGNSNSSPGNQYSGFVDQVSMQDGTSFSTQEYQEKNLIGSADGLGLNSGFNLENLQQVNSHQNNGFVQEFCGRREMAGPSETSQEKTVMQVVPSQNVATLDPTEERILFGSDDNLWESFGKGTNVGPGGYNMLDGVDYFGFPSVQSGRWSALMQSAVAETSSGDVGLQEEWSGLTFCNNPPTARTQQAPTVSDNGKQDHFSLASNGLQTVFTPNSGPLSIPDVANVNSLSTVPRVQQSGVKSLDEESMTKHSEFTQMLPGEEAKCLDHRRLEKCVDNGSFTYKKPDHSSEVESNAKSISGSWTNQRSILTSKIGGQSLGKSNGWNVINSLPQSSVAALEDQRDKSSLQASKSSVQKGPMLGTFGLVGSPQVKSENSTCGQVAGTDSSFVRTSQENSQHFPNSTNIDIWKHVDSSVNLNVNEIPRKCQPHVDKSQPNFNSLGSNSLDNGNAEAHEMQNLNIKENSTNSFHQMSHQSSSSGVRQSSGLHASDSCALPGAKQKSSTFRKASAVRKFHYHPMGDVEVDVKPSQGGKHDTYRQSSPQQVLHQQLKFPSHIARNTVGCSSGFHGENAPNNSTISSQKMLELLHKVDQAREPGNGIHFSSSNNNRSSEMPEAESSGVVWQNQSSASQGFTLQLAPPSQRLTTSDLFLSSGSPSQAKNYPTSNNVTSTTWLASASSLQHLPHSCEISQGELKANLSSTIGKNDKNFQENISASFPPGFHNSGSRYEDQQMSGTGGRPTSSQPVNLPFDRLSSQSQEMQKSFERAPSSQSAFASLPGTSGTTSYNDIASADEPSRLGSYSQNHASDSAQQFPLLDTVQGPQLYDASLTSQEGAPSNISPFNRTRVSAQQHSFGSQNFRVPNNTLRSSLQSNLNAEATLSQHQKLEEKIAQRGGNVSSESGTFVNSHAFVGKEHPPKGDNWRQVSSENEPSQKTMSASQGKELVTDHLAVTSFSNPTSTQREIEAFGRSLIPNNNVHQNYSLMHQLQGMKNTEVDPSVRSLKRHKGPGGAVDAQLVTSQGGQHFYEQNTRVRDSSPINTSMPSGDSDMPRFSPKPTGDQYKSAPSRDLFSFGQNDSQNFASSNTVGSVRGEHSQISPQMAPSWFDRYGTFKNGQILPTNDAQKTANMKTIETPFSVGRPSLLPHNSMDQGNVAAEVRQCGSQKVLLPAALASENFASPQPLLSDAADLSLVVMRPKKRKTATPEIVPWHKGVMQGSQRLRNISVAEVDWAQASNRLTEKVEDETVILEDGLPFLSSKRRLILTTQLMQLLFRPPVASLFSAGAVLHHESVAYSAARATLGDACSAHCSAGHDTLAPSNSENLLPEKIETPERISDRCFLKVMEDLVNRAKEIETDLLSLDKRPSVSDLRVECQELEKFSVINRFAKFHGRAQTDASETLSSSNAPAIAQKPYPQRYVIALPMPRNLPERVQCLSL